MVTATVATLDYDIWLGGASAANVVAATAEAPIPTSILNDFGVGLIDVTTAGANPVVYTVALSLVPDDDAIAVATVGSASGSPILDVDVTHAGRGYVVSPVISFSGGRPPTVDNPGFETHPVVESAIGPPNFNARGYAFAYLKAVQATVAVGGTLYSSSTFAVVNGPQRNGGVQATVALTIVAGIITGVAITNAGSGYTKLPTVQIVDPSGTPGSGGVVNLSMGVDEIVVTNPGSGFASAPTVNITPLFAALHPPGSDQAGPFRNLMTAALQQACTCPVSAREPVLT